MGPSDSPPAKVMQAVSRTLFGNGALEDTVLDDAIKGLGVFREGAGGDDRRTS